MVEGGNVGTLWAMSALNSRRLDAFTTMTGQSIIGVVDEVGASKGTCECY